MVEDPDMKVVSFSETIEVYEQPYGLEVDSSSEPEPEPEPEHQSSTEAMSAASKPNTSSSTDLLVIELRIWQLHNKLQRIESGRKNKEEGAGEDGELEAIQKELEELLVREEFVRQQLSLHKDQRHTHPRVPSSESEPEPEEEPEPEPEPEPELTPETGQENPLSAPIPVDNLTFTPAVVECPSCREVITTETHRKVGTTMWMMCFVSSIVGCFAGCCLIPFVIDRLKDVHHQCPLCQSHIYSYKHL